MGNLDIIFQKRLERIREELDCYINTRLESKKEFQIDSLPAEVESQKKKPKIEEKLLNYMKFYDPEEDFYDDDYYDEEEDASAPSEKSSQSVFTRPQVPRRPELYSIPGSASKDGEKTLHIPDFLWQKSGKGSDLDSFLSRKEESFSAMLLRLIDEKGLKDSEVYKRANIDRRLFSKIRGDDDYVPSKKTAISFCLALRLNMKEAEILLKTAGYTLSASSRFDLIIMYLIENREYNVHFANIVLEDYGEGTLSR